MANIDVILDANDEVTPTFTVFDMVIPSASVSSDAIRLVVQAIRTTDDNTATNIVVERCMIGNDGALVQHHPGTGTSLVDAWDQEGGNLISLGGNERSEIASNYKMIPGLAYRVKKDSGGTNPIRIVVYTPSRPAS